MRSQVLPDTATIVKAAGAIAATLLIGLCFIASYAGALHAPTPHQVPLAVTDQVPDQIISALQRGDTFKTQRVADPAAAATTIDHRNAYASIAANPNGSLDLTIAPAASVTVSQLITTELAPQLRSASAKVKLTTVHPLTASDTRGTVGFYLGIGWVVTGYLGATLLGLAMGTKLTPRHLAWRLSALTVLGLGAGLAGTAIATAIGDYPDGFFKLTLLGLLTVLAVGSATVAFQTFLGVGGTGIAILLFVVLGNPSAGGAAPPELLPGFWRVIGQLLPNGASVTGIKHAVYFRDAGISSQALVLLTWLSVTAGVTLGLGRRGRGLNEAETEASLAATVA